MDLTSSIKRYGFPIKVPKRPRAKITKFDESSSGETVKKVPLGSLTQDGRFSSSPAHSGLGEQPGMPLKASAIPVSTESAASQHNPYESEYQLVQIDKIDDNPYILRIAYDHGVIAKLAASISIDGQLTPGLAVKRGGRFILIDGHYRKMALKNANFVEMKLLLRADVSDQELYCLWRKENIETHPPQSIENAFAWNNLLDKGVYLRRKDIAEGLEVSESTVSKTIALLKASPALIDFARIHLTVGLSVWYELYLLGSVMPTKRVLEIAKKFVEGDIKRDEIADLRKKISTKNQRKQNRTSR